MRIKSVIVIFSVILLLCSCAAKEAKSDIVSQPLPIENIAGIAISTDSETATVAVDGAILSFDIGDTDVLAAYPPSKGDEVLLTKQGEKVMLMVVLRYGSFVLGEVFDVADKILIIKTPGKEIFAFDTSSLGVVPESFIPGDTVLVGYLGALNGVTVTTSVEKIASKEPQEGEIQGVICDITTNLITVKTQDAQCITLAVNPKDLQGFSLQDEIRVNCSLKDGSVLTADSPILLRYAKSDTATIDGKLIQLDETSVTVKTVKGNTLSFVCDEKTAVHSEGELETDSDVQLTVEVGSDGAYRCSDVLKVGFIQQKETVQGRITEISDTTITLQLEDDVMVLQKAGCEVVCETGAPVVGNDITATVTSTDADNHSALQLTATPGDAMPSEETPLITTGAFEGEVLAVTDKTICAADNNRTIYAFILGDTPVIGDEYLKAGNILTVQYLGDIHINPTLIVITARQSKSP